MDECVEKSSQKAQKKKSGVKPGVHLTCRRLEGEDEFGGCGGCHLCEQTKHWEMLLNWSGGALTGNTAKGKNQGVQLEFLGFVELTGELESWQLQRLTHTASNQSCLGLVLSTLSGSVCQHCLGLGLILLVVCGHLRNRLRSFLSRDLMAADCGNSASKARARGAERMGPKLWASAGGWPLLKSMNRHWRVVGLSEKQPRGTPAEILPGSLSVT